jgi:protein SCO1
MKSAFQILTNFYQYAIIFGLAFSMQVSIATEMLAIRVDRTITNLPDVQLVSMLEKKSTLKNEIEADAPIIINFVFTTCSTICSVQTLVLSQAKQLFDNSLKNTKILTFTIDPDNDTPAQLRKFSSSFNIDTGWIFYTGTYDAMLHVQKFFNVYRGSKANHPPIILMKKNKTAPWVRMEGFPKPQDIVAQLHALPSK